jgi:small membrane protein
MLILQLLVFLFIFIAFIGALLRFREGKLGRQWFIFWSVFWIAAGVVVLLPQTARGLASVFGIARGVDLVVYISIIVLFALVFRILLKIEALEQEITKVVRHAALNQPEKKE